MDNGETNFTSDSGGSGSNISQATAATDGINQGDHQEALLLLSGGSLTPENYARLQDLIRLNPGLEMKLPPVQAPQEAQQQQTQLAQQAQADVQQQQQQQQHVNDVQPTGLTDDEARRESRQASDRLAEQAGFEAGLHSNNAVAQAVEGSIKNGTAFNAIPTEVLNQDMAELGNKGSRIEVVHEVGDQIVGMGAKPHQEEQHEFASIIDHKAFPKLAGLQDYGTGKFPPDPPHPGNSHGEKTSQQPGVILPGA